jgi:transcriptional regulator with XRE-family HTH domain
MSIEPAMIYSRIYARNAIVNKEVGARLRRFRFQSGLSLFALGKMIGISAQQLSKYEKGINTLNAIRLVQLATVLKIEIDQLLPNVAFLDCAEVKNSNF